MDTNRETVLSAMYQGDDDNPNEVRSLASPSDRTRRIRVGAIEYEVPTVSYMQQLEQTLAHHSRIINHQQRVIDRLNATISKNTQSQSGHEHDIDDLKREMIRKINQRDYV
jgi:hypothetical protein